MHSFHYIFEILVDGMEEKNFSSYLGAGNISFNRRQRYEYERDYIRKQKSELDDFQTLCLLFWNFQPQTRHYHYFYFRYAKKDFPILFAQFSANDGKQKKFRKLQFTLLIRKQDFKCSISSLKFQKHLYNRKISSTKNVSFTVSSYPQSPR